MAYVNKSLNKSFCQAFFKKPRTFLFPIRSDTQRNSFAESEGEDDCFVNGAEEKPFKSGAIVGKLS